MNAKNLTKKEVIELLESYERTLKECYRLYQKSPKGTLKNILKEEVINIENETIKLHKILINF